MVKVSFDLDDQVYTLMKLKKMNISAEINKIVCNFYGIVDSIEKNKEICEIYLTEVITEIAKEDQKLIEEKDKILEEKQQILELKQDVIEYINQNGGKKAVLSLYEKSFIDDRYSGEWNIFLDNCPVKFTKLMEIIKEIE